MHMIPICNIFFIVVITVFVAIDNTTLQVHKPTCIFREYFRLNGGIATGLTRRAHVAAGKVAF
jgi:hypothetical protein